MNKICLIESCTFSLWCSLNHLKVLQKNSFDSWQYKKVCSIESGLRQKGHLSSFSGTNQKPERRRPFGTGLVRHCPQGLCSPFFTFLRALFFRPFRLSLAPTICPWVSKDDLSSEANLYFSSSFFVVIILCTTLKVNCLSYYLSRTCIYSQNNHLSSHASANLTPSVYR